MIRIRWRPHDDIYGYKNWIQNKYCLYMSSTFVNFRWCSDPRFWNKNRMKSRFFVLYFWLDSYDYNCWSSQSRYKLEAFILKLWIIVFNSTIHWYKIPNKSSRSWAKFSWKFIVISFHLYKYFNYQQNRSHFLLKTQTYIVIFITNI